MKVAHDGRLWGERNFKKKNWLKSSPKIPRFLNVKNQVEVDVELEGELGGTFFLCLPPPKLITLYKLSHAGNSSGPHPEGSKQKFGSWRHTG
jgi:hypothetical protein